MSTLAPGLVIGETTQKSWLEMDGVLQKLEVDTNKDHERYPRGYRITILRFHHSGL